MYNGMQHRCLFTPNYAHSILVSLLNLIDRKSIPGEFFLSALNASSSTPTHLMTEGIQPAVNKLLPYYHATGV